jgi:polysaccharide deacetylase family protein (PEP-CTERM system associated)
MKNALTFDVEEYFHAEAFARVLRPEEWPTLESRVTRSTERLLDILDRERVRATFFVLGWVAERHPALVREIASLGHEIACHGYGHRMIQHLSRPEFERDVTRAKRALEDAVGRPVLGYRAPTFSIMRATLWSLDVLVEAGFRYDSSIFPVVHDPLRHPRRPTLPAPAEDAQRRRDHRVPDVDGDAPRAAPARGGRRLLPPLPVPRDSAGNRPHQRRAAARHGVPPPVGDRPRSAPPPRRSAHPFRHLVNVGKTESRLRRLIAELSFAPASEVLAETGLLAIGDVR